MFNFNFYSKQQSEVKMQLNVPIIKMEMRKFCVGGYFSNDLRIKKWRWKMWSDYKERDLCRIFFAVKISWSECFSYFSTLWIYSSKASSYNFKKIFSSIHYRNKRSNSNHDVVISMKINKNKSAMTLTYKEHNLNKFHSVMLISSFTSTKSKN